VILTQPRRPVKPARFGNIVIRTIFVLEGYVHFYVGGGIVADSDPEEVRTAIAELLRANGLEETDSRIRLTVTPGEGEPVGDLVVGR